MTIGSCKLPGLRNDRGIALLMVLLVTALLLALVFEFAYATRISLNSAVNFRDGQRAYFLALTGINAFKSNGPKLRESFPPGETQPVPLLAEGDAVLFKWEDEKGKLSINAIDKSPVADWVDRLFSKQGLATGVFDKVQEKRKEGRFNLLTELHAVMTTEDFRKVEPFLTVQYSDNMVNPNTASKEVLESIGFSASAAEQIVQQRKEKAFDQESIKPFLPSGFVPTSSYFSSAIFKVYAYATVGGYTKQIEAIINGNAVTYWKAL